MSPDGVLTRYPQMVMPHVTSVDAGRGRTSADARRLFAGSAR